ncbi:MAG: sigma-70 family RNA polymerase sigma factor [Terriglobales bacterium]
MADPEIATILQGLRSRRAQDAWAEFLHVYSPSILQVAQLSSGDPDAAADCFLFACERLSRDNFRRLLRFRPEGPATFTTWLKVVVRNLCLDWHRKKFGRRRTFRSIQELPQLQREVYQCRCEEGLSADATFSLLQTRFPKLTPEDITQAEERARRALSSRQNWLLSIRRQKDKLSAATDYAGALLDLQIVDPSPSPETLASRHQERYRLGTAVAHLPKLERVMLRLRYEQGLTLEKVARLTGLEDAQTADRRIKDILRRLRGEMSSSGASGKTNSMSV